MNPVPLPSTRWQAYLRDCSALAAIAEPMEVAIERVIAAAHAALGMDDATR